MNEPTLTKPERRVIYFLKYGSMLGLLALFLFSEPWRTRGCYLNENSLLERKFSGEVVRKFIDKPNHSAEVLELDNEEKVFLVYEDHYNDIDVGDYVRKISGSFRLEVRKSDTLLVLLHQMPCKEEGGE